MRDVFEPRVSADRFKLLAQFGDDQFEQLGVKHARRLGQRTEQCPPAAQPLLYLFQFAGLFHRAQRADDGVKEKEQFEHAELIKVQATIAGAVAFAAGIMQSAQQRRQLVEVLQAGHVLLRNLRPLRLRHAQMMRETCKMRKSKWARSLRIFWRK